MYVGVFVYLGVDLVVVVVLLFFFVLYDLGLFDFEVEFVVVFGLVVVF